MLDSPPPACAQSDGIVTVTGRGLDIMQAGGLALTGAAFCLTLIETLITKSSDFRRLMHENSFHRNLERRSSPCLQIPGFPADTPRQGMRYETKV